MKWRGGEGRGGEGREMERKGSSGLVNNNTSHSPCTYIICVFL